MLSTAEASTVEEFHALVNMSAQELENWLEQPASRRVGQQQANGESIGHESGRWIVDILRTHRADLADDDFLQMRRTSNFIKRHLTQRPEGDIEHMRWRYSLMNWGHDPLKDPLDV